MMAEARLESNIHIRKAVREDLPEMVDTVAAAFDEDSLSVTLYPTGKDFPHIQRMRHMLKLRARICSPGVLSTVAVDSLTGRIMGYASWELRGKSSSMDALKSKCSQTWSTRMHTAVENVLLRWEGTYFDKVIDHVTDRQVLAKMRQHPLPPFTGLSDYMFLRGIYVSPDAQRRGIGMKLLRYGLDYAEQDRLPVGLMSSHVAQKMYTRAGFKVVGYERVVSNSYALMLYEPESVRNQVLEQGWRVKSQSRFTGPSPDLPTVEEHLPVA